MGAAISPSSATFHFLVQLQVRELYVQEMSSCQPAVSFLGSQILKNIEGYVSPHFPFWPSNGSWRFRLRNLQLFLKGLEAATSGFARSCLPMFWFQT